MQLYVLLLQLYGCEEDVAKRSHISGVMTQMACTCGSSSWYELADQHAEQLFAKLCTSSAT